MNTGTYMEGCTPRTDHDLSDLSTFRLSNNNTVPHLLLAEVVQDLQNSTNPTQETCATTADDSGYTRPTLQHELDNTYQVSCKVGNILSTRYLLSNIYIMKRE